VVRHNLAANWHDDSFAGFRLGGSGHKLINNIAVTCENSGYVIDATDVTESGNQQVCSIP
jgi:hypothetical protein